MEQENVITAYKGFDKDLKCRGFQYEVGKEYEIEGDVKCCNNGFHACEHPLGVFGFYSPSKSRYCIVEQSGKMDKKEEKNCSSKIAIKAELTIAGMVKAAIDFVFKNSKKENGATGDCGASSATGNCGASSAGGLDSIALAAGYKCKAKGEIGCWLVIAERDEYDNNNKTYPIKDLKAVKVDGEKIKADTWYTLKDGEFVEVKD